MMAPHKSECPSGDGQTQEQSTESSEIVAPSGTLGKEYVTLQAEFAMLGHALNHSRRADDGHVSYIVARWGQARYFTHLNDVRAFLAQIGGRP